MRGSSTRSLIEQNAAWLAFVVFLVGLAVIPVLTNSIVDHPPEYDELLHVLAARGISETGQPVIADGLYPRASLYTGLVSLVTQSGQHELFTARLPALVSGALLLAVLGAWVTVKAGWIAGLAAAAVLAIIPETPYMSVLVRFYTLHALLMLFMLALVYEALTPNRKIPITLLLLFLAGIAFVVGMQLQVLSQVTAMGAVAGAIALVAFDKREPILGFMRQHRILTLIVLISLCIGAIYAANMVNIIDKLRGVTPAWSASRANDLFFYSKSLTPRLPLFWPIFPALVLLALFHDTRMSLYFLAVALVCLAVSSIASQKAMRYVYHCMPAIALLAGLGLKALVQLVSEFIHHKLALKPANALILTLGLTTACLLNTVEVQRAIKLATGKGTIDKSIPVMSEPDWLLALPQLETHLASVDTVVASSGVKSLYAFGRYDYELSRTVILDTLTNAEFGEDARTGRQVISSPESIKTVIDTAGAELIVLENRMMHKDYSAPSDTIAVINAHCDSLQIATESQLSAWICQ